MRMVFGVALAIVGGVMVCAHAAETGKSPFESLGKPVPKGGLMGCIVGPGPTDGSERIYFNFRQEGGKLFLVSADPDTGKSEQYQSPVGTGAWGFIVGPDNKIYLGTHQGDDPSDDGQVLVFDPKHPEKQIQVVGRPSATETYLWMFTIGKDGKIYGCTYPGAKLVSYDPKTGALADLGVMDDSQKYSRSVCTGPDGKIYVGIGYGRGNVVMYDPATGKHESILPDAYRKEPEQTVGEVYAGVDGNVYIKATRVDPAKPDAKPGDARPTTSVTLLVKDGKAELSEKPATAVSHTKLKDGRVVQNPNLNGTYELAATDGKVEKKTFTYKGASGIFMVSNGPLGRIYGGTWMPCEVFSYDPATGKTENPGNPCEVGGEIYSMLDHHGSLYVCAYPGSFLSKWDPSKPWNYGHDPDNNPRGFGPLGPGHLRPRAMVHGPNELIYIGSYPEYGRPGGSLGVWDPAQEKLIENYHPLVKDQSIATLVYDPGSGLIFGGSSTAGGGGSTPAAPEAKFFAFDPKAKKLVLEEAPYPGAQTIVSMALAGRKIFGVADAGKLFVYDIDAKKYVHKAELGLGEMPDCSLALWKDGKFYGVSQNKVFRLDPDTFATTVLAEYPGKIRCGLAIDDHGIYFGDKAELMRWNWPAKP
ncbi:MAG: PQQ-like beta-propeller repeat protein [Candidatus Hydrogenedentes bacterium]|nr:PQQ-like beta-propeller repeat protein [Candidatus Hydrogenedentota bacterium]